MFGRKRNISNCLNDVGLTVWKDKYRVDHITGLSHSGCVPDQYCTRNEMESLLTPHHTWESPASYETVPRMQMQNDTRK